MATTPKRPISINLLYIWLLIVGIANILGGIFIIIDRYDLRLLAQGYTSTELVTTGIITIIFGAITTLVASLLHNGSEFVRILIAVIASLNLAAGVWNAIAFNGTYRASGVFSALFAGLVLWLLFNHRSAEWFEEEEVYNEKLAAKSRR